MAVFNNKNIFQSILDPQKNHTITWNDLLALKTLGVSRLENNKCIFTLFDLGSVTFHKGHGKDKSEYANAAGIDELRTLLNRMGFENTTFTQELEKTKKSLSKSTPK